VRVECPKKWRAPRGGIASLIQIGLELPHGAEAAIRVWSSIDPEVYDLQLQVDQLRYDVMYSSAMEILDNQQQAQMFARWAIHLLVGHEQATLPRDTAALS